MNRKYCLILVTVLAMGFGTLAAEAQVPQSFDECDGLIAPAPAAVRETTMSWSAVPFFYQGANRRCGPGFAGFALTGCMLTCLLASGHRRTRV